MTPREMPPGNRDAHGECCRPLVVSLPAQRRRCHPAVPIVLYVHAQQLQGCRPPGSTLTANQSSPPRQAPNRKHPPATLEQKYRPPDKPAPRPRYSRESVRVLQRQGRSRAPPMKGVPVHHLESADEVRPPLSEGY